MYHHSCLPAPSLFLPECGSLVFCLGFGSSFFGFEACVNPVCGYGRPSLVFLAA